MRIEVTELSSLGPADRAGFFERASSVSEVRPEVKTIVERVREEGDVALRSYAREFDDVDVGHLEVTDQCESAYSSIDSQLRSAIDTAAANITEFHREQLPTDWERSFSDGRTLGRRFRPIERVGVYVPGGSAAYPSSALMGIIPAVVAGVDHIVVTTPPAEEINPVTLAAIHAAGADRVFRVGGAQAIAALAYGTESVPAVQKVVGPGNRWVTAAKSIVRGAVEIDFLAGPSEVVVIADGNANPEYVAAELLAQAEHDTHASAVLVTDDETLATDVAAGVTNGCRDAKRSEIIEAALSNEASGILLAHSMSEAIAFTETFAPEHLSIMAEDPESILERIDSAGSVFVGEHTPVAAGDYASGTNHVLPTGGLAHVSGGLSTDTFLRASTIQRLTDEGLCDLAQTITTLADAEGLDAHAESVRIRCDPEE